jgi:hypothetical protein
MAKTSGLGDNFYVGGYDLSGDINSLSSISGGNTPLDITGINKSAVERIGGQRAGQIEFLTYHNASAAQAHARLSLLPTTDVILTYARGTTIGNPAACMVAKLISYDPTRGDDGDLKCSVQAQSNGYGIEWGVQGTAGKRQDTAATAAAAVTAVDYGAVGLSFGLQAYLQVFSFTGTSCTVKLQESSNDGADAYADVTGGAFAAATGITSERIATSATQSIERYLKVVTTGTFSECTFSVVIVRNDSATVF